MGILRVPAPSPGTALALSLSSSSHGTLQRSLPPFLYGQWQQTTQPAQPGATASPMPHGLSSAVLNKETICVLLSSAILFPLKQNFLEADILKTLTSPTWLKQANKLKSYELVYGGR